MRQLPPAYPDVDKRAPRPKSGKSGPARNRRALPLVAFDDVLMSTTGFYLVKNLIPRAGLVIVWGAPKCGKSFWTFDMLMHVAFGWEYRGLRVKGGPVVYCALEGAERLQEPRSRRSGANIRNRRARNCPSDVHAARPDP